ncbi:hypothetical protein DNTS_008815 [Danionella cerebrum]|uniref:Caprin-1 dimerization domain-containing protein n=1 Tax=Danionella cerebrum TaxID=2873325 RepID=A0A553R1B0_9TELE|nr:hypothetical protein DNTS_008815 [Danionella translucida]TRY95961.1 hypothetical protein DNTS_008815 [Danionella translucida]
MPSATNGTRTVKSSSPDLGSEPGSMNQIPTTNQLTGSQSEPMKQVLVVLEKKVRNMEKKKCKLDDYRTRSNNGERLNQDQLEALSKYQEVIHNLEFTKELQKSFLALGQEIQKTVKKVARREQLLREELEQKRIKRVLELQFVLDRLGDENVRQELLQGVAGLSLSESDLSSLDEFYKLVGPDRDQSIRLTEQYQDASQHFWELLEGKDKSVAGTTYKALNDTLEHLLESGYFDRELSHHNGVSVEEEDQVVPVKESEPEEQPTERVEVEVTEDYPEPLPIATTEFVNTQFVSESTYSPGDEQRGEWSTEPEVVESMLQPVQSAPSPVVQEPHPLPTVTPTPPPEPVCRQQVVQDLMAQMQGPYNFMQESMLDFEGHSIDPAIVSAQPMKPPASMEMPLMVCQQAQLTQPLAVAVQSEPTQASMPLMERTPPSSALPPASQIQLMQPGSKQVHSSGINVNAAPFQSMQTVFNLNAPVPPTNGADSMEQPAPFQNSYSHNFNGQTQHPVEQTDVAPEQLQSVVGTFHSPEQSLVNPAGHQALSPQSGAQGNGFNRQAQSFYNSRGVARGVPRNPRGMVNGYRGSSNGFRGGYEGYRPPFSNPPNSGYGQTQFTSPRDYSSSNYQRDGYQQNYKRGGGSQGARGVSRGSAPTMRS